MREAFVTRDNILYSLTIQEVHHLVNKPNEPYCLKRGQIKIELTQQERDNAREIGIYNHITGRLLGSYCMMSDQAEEAAKEIMEVYDISRFPAGLEPILQSKADEKLNEIEAELPF